MKRPPFGLLSRATHVVRYGRPRRAGIRIECLQLAIAEVSVHGPWRRAVSWFQSTLRPRRGV